MTTLEKKLKVPDDSNMLAPPQPIKTAVLFLVFNRLDTTKQVFESIRLAKPPRLYIASDGARSSREGEVAIVQAVREYVLTHIDWECEVKTLLREQNLGCKYAVSSAINWFFESEDMGVILEDDCLPHPVFFRFCEQMLERYRDDERVMMIGGTNYLLDKLNISDSYVFSRYFAIWGWATWARAWRQYDISMRDWENYKKEGQINSFYSQRFMQKHMSSMFDLAYQNHIDTWDIQWSYSCLFNNGLSIVPKVNMITNIGLMGTHTSSDKSNNLMPVFDLNIENLIYPVYVFPNYRYDNTFFHLKIKSSITTRIRRLLRRISGLLCRNTISAS